jgi:predicted membrane chloride channel (bestrophin family)
MFVSDMNVTTSYVYRAIAVVIVTYLLWRLNNIIIKYKKWWTATNAWAQIMIAKL